MITKKQTRPDAEPAPQTAEQSPLDALFDPALFEDSESEDLSVDDILKEYHRQEREFAGLDAFASDDAAPEPEPEDVPAPAQPDAAPVPPDGAHDLPEAGDPELLAQAEADVAGMKADLVGGFQSVDSIYRSLGVEEQPAPQEESSVKSMLKRWDLFSKLQQRIHAEPAHTPDGVPVSQLPPQDLPAEEAPAPPDIPDIPGMDGNDAAELPDIPDTPVPPAPEAQPEPDSTSEAAEEPKADIEKATPRAVQNAALKRLQALSNRLPKRKKPKEADAPAVVSSSLRDIDADNDPAYAAPLPELEDDDEDIPVPRPAAPRRSWNLKAAVTGQCVTFLAALDSLRDKNGSAIFDLTAQVHDPEDDREDVHPKKAAKLYGKQAQRLRPRALAATLLAGVLLVLSVLYLAGVLLPDGLRDIRVMALLCLLIQLFIMLLGLDIFSTGIFNLFDGVPGMESLVSVSCVASALDALVLHLSGSAAYGLPFCAVSAFSMAFALWGSYLSCLGYRLSFRTLAQIQKPMALSSEQGLSEHGSTLLRSYGDPAHFIRRSEAPDLAESTYRLFAPLFLVVSLLFGLLAALGHGELSGFFHCFAACVSACASLPAFLCFALPFAAAARKLRRKGCAISGFAGCREIGACSRIVVYDDDLFPKGTVVVERVISSSEVLAKKLTIYTASLLHESESALTHAFDLLLSNKGHTRLSVRKFSQQEGGGFSGIINDEQVLVGPAAFLNLMGIRVPQRLKDQASVFTAINGQLAGAFCLKYKTTAASRMAFEALFKSKHHPFFVVRDFNVTPLLIQKHFGVPHTRFEFPVFTDRYRISAAAAERPAAAVLSKNEIGPLADCVSICYELYTVTRRIVLMSLLGSAIGLLAAFVLSFLGLFQAASAAVLSIFMLLWLILTFLFAGKHK